MVVTVTLNRSDKLNAIDLRVVTALIDIERRIAERRDVHVVVLRGAGRVFSAGADLHHIDSIYKDPQRSRHYLNTLRDACLGLEHLRQPVVAAVHGMVLAGGLELALACDLIVAEESTRIGDQHMNWGFIAGGGSTQRLPRWIGPTRARDLLYTGRWVSAREAWEMGLVSRIVDDGTLDAASAELAEELAKRSPEALARTKALVRHSQEVPLEQGLDLEIETVMSYYAQPEFEAAMTGFKTRTPRDFRR
jgi:enoyl-CoA hydratase/carnithine racemase